MADTHRFVVEVAGIELDPAALKRIQSALEDAIGTAMAELALEVEVSPLNAQAREELVPYIAGPLPAGMVVRPPGWKRA